MNEELPAIGGPQASATDPLPGASDAPWRGLRGWRTTLRLLRRGAGVALLTPGCFGLWVLGAPWAWAAGRRRRWRDWIIHTWGRSLCWALGIRIRREGPIPRGGCLLVCNHVSYVDILVLAAQGPCVFLSKAEVADWPGLGWMAARTGVLFVKREDRRSLPAVAALLREEVEGGSVVVLFPEGTSGPGNTVLPFRASLLAPAAEAGFPVAIAALSYRTPEGHIPASQAVCWWGDMTLGSHLSGLLQLPHVDAQIRFAPEPIHEGDRKVLAHRLWEAVQALFEPIQ
jgi:1-acyl-sn-glycerol-3-phosphate acyltransferase